MKIMLYVAIGLVCALLSVFPGQGLCSEEEEEQASEDTLTMFPVNSKWQFPVVPGPRAKDFSGNEVFPPPFIKRLATPVVEDPDWYEGRPGLIGMKGMLLGAGRMGGEYIRALEKALQGNPLAMVDLMVQNSWAADWIAAAHPELPAFMHSEKYWRNWAARFTSLGWTYARESEYRPDDGFGQEARWAGVELGDPECLYLSYLASDWGLKNYWYPMFFYWATEAGWGETAALLSLEYQTGDPFFFTVDVEKKRYYRALGQQRGSHKAFLFGAFDSIAGLQGTPQDIVAAHMQYYLWLALRATRDGLFLIESDIPYIAEAPTEEVLKVSRGYVIEDRMIKDVVNQYIALTDPLLEDTSFRITPQQQEEAVRRAQDWLKAYKRQREEELAPERVRRSALLQELREELAVAIAYIDKKHRLEREDEEARIRAAEWEKIWFFLRFAGVAGVAVLLCALWAWRKRVAKREEDKQWAKFRDL